MKIWSLLPSATEMLFALGLDDEVTGVTHECDYPPQANSKPRVTFSHIDSSRSSREIDRQVTDRFRAGLEIYGIDEDRLRVDPPDMIVRKTSARCAQFLRLISGGIWSPRVAARKC